MGARAGQGQRQPDQPEHDDPRGDEARRADHVVRVVGDERDVGPEQTAHRTVERGERRAQVLAE